MKIRNGFVSNSSSSSFLIYGVYTDVSVPFDSFTTQAQEFLKNHKDYTEVEGSDVFGYELMDDLFSHFKIGYDYYEGFYVGESWSKVADNQTGKQFKDSVKEKLEEIFKSDCDIFKTLSTHKEAWHD